MKKTFALAAFAAFFSTAASADALFDGVVNQLHAQGYQQIQVQQTPSQYTFFSERGGVMREIVVDRRTGALLSDKTTAPQTYVITQPQQPQQPQVGFAPQQQPAVNPGDQIAAQVVGAMIGHIFDQID